MRFFKSKKKATAADAGADTSADKEQQTLVASASAEANKPAKTAENEHELKGDLDTAVVPSLSAEEAAPAEKKELAAEKAAEKTEEKPKAETAKAEPAKKSASVTTAVRLFPGFEGKPFEIGYAGFKSEEYGIEEETPMLLMRWKAGEARWFPLPPVFNKAVLEQIHEGDNDLDRLLIGYGYDAEQLVRKKD